MGPAHSGAAGALKQMAAACAKAARMWSGRRTGAWAIAESLEPRLLMAAQPLLQYSFDQSVGLAGAEVVSTGIYHEADATLTMWGNVTANSIPSVTVPGTRTLELTTGGLGVSGQAGDRALDNQNTFGDSAANHTETAGPVAALAELKSFTLAGWVRGQATDWQRLITVGADGSASTVQLLSNGSDAFQLVVNGTTLVSPSYSSTQALPHNANGWVFVAVSYDGTQNSSNVTWYIGDKSHALSTFGTQDLAAGTLGASVGPLTLGGAYNRTDRNLDGMLDNVRIFGSAVDGTGVVGQADLEALRATDADVHPLPTGWSDADIGGPSLPGSAFSTGDGSVVVSGGGNDIWRGSDEFHFASTLASGDQTLVAQILSVDNTNRYAKAALMFRDSMAADAPFVLLSVTPGYGVEFNVRDAAGTNVFAVARVDGLVAPQWLKLVRQGDSFTAYCSADGSDWTELGTQAVTLGATCRAGLAVLSHDESVLNSATFAHVALSESTAPLAAYRFDGNSSTITDQSGHGFDGTLVGGATLGVGRDKIGQALVLDGTGYVDLGNPDGLNVTGPITLSAWIKPTSINGVQDIISHGYTLSPNAGVFLRINAGRYEVGSWDGTGYAASAVAPAGDANTWVHLAGVYDGTSWQLYRDGVLVATTAAPVGAVSVGADWQIGASSVASDRRNFVGSIDDVGIYDRALGSGEIAGLATPILTVPDAPTLVTASATRPYEVDLSWTPVPGATGYAIYRNTTSGQPTTVPINADLVVGTRFTDTGLPQGTAYYYTVTAVNAAGTSAPAPETQVTTVWQTPVAYYRFLENSGGTTADVTGHGFAGTLVGGAGWVVGRDGMSSGLGLDGTGYVDLGNPDGLNFTGQITLSAWIKPTSLGGVQDILSHGYTLAPNAAVFLRINAGHYEVGSWDGTGYVASAVAPAGDANTWVHLTGVYDGTSWQLYRNGELLSSSTAAVGSMRVPGSWQIGASAVANDRRNFQGTIDDAQIYDRALSVTEISSLAAPVAAAPAAPTNVTALAARPYQIDLAWTASADSVFGYNIYRSTASGQESATPLNASPVTGTTFTDTGLANATGYFYVVKAVNDVGVSWASHEAGATTLRQTPVASYDFSESTGTTTADQSGQGFSGALVGGASFVPGQEGFGNALSLDGTGYVNLGNPEALNLTGTITLSAWIKPSSLGGVQDIVAHGYTLSPNGEVFLRINAGHYEVGSWDGTGYVASAVAPAGDANTWVHLTGVYDGTSWQLYRNGELLVSTPAARGALPVAADWQIGASAMATDRRFFTGAIDNVKLYDRALDASEITALLAAGPGAPSGLTATADSSSRITLQWTAPAGGGTGYYLYRSTTSGEFGAPLNTSPLIDTTFVDTGLASDTSYFYSVQAVSVAGQGPRSAAVSATTLLAGLPRGWGDADVGTPDTPGSATSDGATWTLTGSGDLWGNADQANFASTLLNGDGSVTANVLSQNASNGWAKTGVMLRASSDANAAYAALLVTPEHGLVLQIRAKAGAETSSAQFDGSLGNFVRLVRAGDQIVAYASTDGVAWRQLQTQRLILPSHALAGLVTASADAWQMTASTFEQVSVTAGLPASTLPAEWQSNDLGVPGLLGGADYTAVPTPTFKIQGSGTDIWGSADHFQFASQPLAADGCLTAKITSLNTANGRAKAGVMIRDGVDADSAYAAVFQTPSNGVFFQWRSSRGESTQQSQSFASDGPVYLRLTRFGDNLIASISSDGTTWHQIGTTVIAMAGAQAGLAVSSCDDTTLATAQFQQVALSTTMPEILAENWTGFDVGGPTPTGSASESNGTFTVNAGGPDIWGGADQFHYVVQNLWHDGAITARITGLTDSDSWAKAGVMIRGDLTDGAPNVSLLVTAGHGTSLQWRVENGQGTVYTNVDVGAPAWVRIVRTGSDFAGYYSTDGTIWTQIGTTRSIPALRGSPVLAGLAVTSHNAEVTTTATFTDVALHNVSSPMVAREATANPSPVLGSATDLTVLGANDAGEAQLTYTWSVLAKPDGAADPAFTINGTHAAQHTTATFSAPGLYTLRATITNAEGSSVTSDVTTTVSALAPLPAGWSESDLGTTVPGGHALSLSDGTWEIQGSGHDIWGTRDQGHYVYQTLTGNGEIIAQVTDLQNTSSWAKAGLMIRTSLDADSAYAGIFFTPGHGLNWQYRTEPGLTTNYTETAATSPGWLKLVRSGVTLTAYRSADGVTWEQLGATQSVELRGAVYIGLAVTAQHDGLLNTATFQNVAIASIARTEPTIVNPASADPNPSTGTTTLSVLGADDYGETDLTYTWSILSKPNGSADPTFIANATHDAATTQATCYADGSYTFRVTVLNSAGLVVTSAVEVTIDNSAVVGPAAPLKVGAFALSAGGAQVSWLGAPENVDGYVISAAKAGSFDFTPFARVTAAETSVLLTNLDVGVYTFAVQAVLGERSSAFTVETDATTVAEPADRAFYRINITGDEGSSIVAFAEGDRSDSGWGNARLIRQGRSTWVFASCWEEAATKVLELEYHDTTPSSYSTNYFSHASGALSGAFAYWQHFTLGGSDFGTAVTVEDRFGFPGHFDKDHNDAFVVLNVERYDADWVNSTGTGDDSDLTDGVSWTGGDNVEGNPEVTLRAAIEQYNINPGQQTVQFKIPELDAGFDGTAFFIAESGLPTITDALTIDGASQFPEFDLNGMKPVIAVDGSGLTVQADDITIDSLSIINAPGAGIMVEGAQSAVLIHNFIGIKPDGVATGGNGTGIWLASGAIGALVQDNIISGNHGSGVFIDGANDAMITGNLIGVDDAGAGAGNGGNGVEIADGSANNVIDNNAIVDSGEDGVLITGSGTDGNTVSNNNIGNDGAGNLLGNGWNGVEIADGAQNNTLGANNAITANAKDGVLITGDGTDNNTVSGNLIGSDDVGPAGNHEDGVEIADGAQGNTISQNTITANTLDGVRIWNQGSDGNTVSGNLIGVDDNGILMGNWHTGVEIADGSANNVIDNNAIVDTLGDGGDGDGVLISGAYTTGNKVTRNNIGNDGTGTLDLGNYGNGVEIADGAHDNWIGQSDVDGNTITDNGVGVYITGGSNNHVVGNLIGIEDHGILMGNWQNGVEIDDGATGNVIDNNAIVASGLDGVLIREAGGNKVTNNKIGIDGTGALGMGNQDNGVKIDNGFLNTLDNNSIVCSVTGDGVLITGKFAIGNTLTNNNIGNDGTGDLDMGNFANGVEIANGASGNWIGQSDVDGNTITDNGVGVYITGGSNNHVVGNLIGIEDHGILMGNWQNGVEIDDGATGNVIDNNAIVGSQDGDGVLITGSETSGNKVTRNNIGNNGTGALDLGNYGNGVKIADGAHDNWIGQSAADGNTITDNGVGVYITAGNDNHVVGNLIGIDDNGIQMGNWKDGVEIDAKASGNIIGTNGDGVGDDTEGNVISGNKLNGVHINGFDATGMLLAETSDNRVAGNYIGTDSNGASAIPNGKEGVLLDGKATNNIVGTNGDGKGDAAEGNVISGNSLNGVRISGVEAKSNRVAGNLIGIAAGGTAALPNGKEGVLISEQASGNIIGTNGDGVGDAAEQNVISGNTLNGVHINGFDATGMFLVETSNNRIAGNFIGTDILGRAMPNGKEGVLLDGKATNNIVGTNGDGKGDAAEGNVISGNSLDGVRISGVEAKSNRVAGNFIGTAFGGAAALPNGKEGVLISEQASGNIIGTNGDGVGDAAEQNVISGNTLNGVHINGFDATGMFLAETSGNRIAGNYIGTDSSGTSAVPNGKDGVRLDGAATKTIIGTDSNGVGDLAEGNCISANAGNGIHLAGIAVTKNMISENRIGLDAFGIGIRLGNKLHGVYIEDSASQNHIGSDDDGVRDALEGNIIAYNGAATGTSADDLKYHGIEIKSGEQNSILHNSIYGNSGRGIDLGEDSFSLPDSNATHAGKANLLQNMPIVDHVSTTAAQQTITWRLHGVAKAQYILEFYSNSDPHISGFGPGEKFLQFSKVTTNDDGDIWFDTTFSKDEHYIAATATDANGNTSEFSMVDTDGDSLADTWETIGIDINEDKIPDYELNSNPNHRDVFVEVDAMSSTIPTQRALDRVVAAFAAAPAASVANYDGTDGITLHAKLDQTTITARDWPDRWTQFDAEKKNFFGTIDDQKAGAVVLAAKALAYRYCIFAQKYGGKSSSGLSEVNVRTASNKAICGNDFMVTLGLPAGGYQTEDKQAATFMHELGHTLGLFHGGSQVDSANARLYNYKPNYHSIMNYMWQLATTRAGWKLDYSHGGLPPLNENDLDEAAGIGGNAGSTVQVWVFDPATGTTRKTNQPEAGAIDYNGNGVATDRGVKVDVNNDGSMNILTDSDDWAAIRTYFLDSPFFATGAHGEDLQVAEDESELEVLQAGQAECPVLPAAESPVVTTVRPTVHSVVGPESQLGGAKMETEAQAADGDNRLNTIRLIAQPEAPRAITETVSSAYTAAARRRMVQPHVPGVISGRIPSATVPTGAVPFGAIHQHNSHIRAWHAEESLAPDELLPFQPRG